MDKYNKKDLIDEVAEKAHLSKRDAKAAIESCFDLIIDNLNENREVNITNFGVFTPKIKKNHSGTNPRTQEKIVVEEKRRVVFRNSKNFSKDLNQ